VCESISQWSETIFQWSETIFKESETIFQTRNYFYGLNETIFLYVNQSRSLLVLVDKKIFNSGEIGEEVEDGERECGLG
jgi:hypothetical protein